MIEYQKIYEIDDTISSVDDDWWHEIGRDENDNDGNSAKITEANYRQSIVNYILNNYDLQIASRYDIEGALVSSYSIDSTDSYNSYYANVQENQKLAVSIDAPATVPGKRIKIFYDSTNYGTLPITSTGANIRFKNGALLTTICLFFNGQSVELESDSTHWNVINDYKFPFSIGLVNTSDWTNRHLGCIDLVLTDSTGFTVWGIIEESTSNFRAITAGITGNTLHLYFVDDGNGEYENSGYFTNGRTITEISHASTPSDTVNGNTKNVDSYVYHAYGLHKYMIDSDMLISDDGTWTTSRRVENMTASNATIIANMWQEISTDNINMQTGTGGVIGMNDNGTSKSYITGDFHYGHFIQIK